MRARARSLIKGLNDVFCANCLNCLNRTNLGEASASIPEGVGELKRVESCEYGDVLSRIYASIGVLRISFTQSGKRALADMNPFISYPRPFR
ncbi:hypothetical protein EI94DRAFT_1741929 [Lactarius quietus]|nr:hypothetical protein EI94DRAFT_1741929 [Lactarius quietus]